MSRAIILEALVYVFRRKYRDIVGGPGSGKSAEAGSLNARQQLAALTTEREEAAADDRT